MQTKESTINNRKRLALFFFASCSLLISGCLINKSLSLDKMIVHLLSVLCGIILIYDVIKIDKTLCFSGKIKQFIAYKRFMFFLLLLIVLIPFAHSILSKFSFFLYAFSGLLGILYSFSFKISDKVFKLKYVFILKNLMIGLAWGSLVLVGAGSLENNWTLMISIFAVVQVFLGSIIRDLPDRENDLKTGIMTFPVVLGEERTISIMHFINFSTILILLFSSFSLYFTSLLLVIILWRFLNLIKISRNVDSTFWGQTANLFTCCLFLIISIIQFYGNI